AHNSEKSPHASKPIAHAPGQTSDRVRSLSRRAVPLFCSPRAACLDSAEFGSLEDKPDTRRGFRSAWWRPAPFRLDSGLLATRPRSAKQARPAGLTNRQVSVRNVAPRDVDLSGRQSIARSRPLCPLPGGRCLPARSRRRVFSQLPADYAPPDRGTASPTTD